MTANHRPLEEGDIELIDRVRATPCLYDTKNPNFRLVYRKEQEWQSLANGLAMSHWEARKRWTVLRDRYARELKQLILHPESTEYGKNDFFLRMDFIRNFVKKREAKRKRKSFDEEDESSENPKLSQLYRNDSDETYFESDDNQFSQSSKSFIINDCQDSSIVKHSYSEQMSRDPIELEQQHDNDQCGEQEYDYVEDTSVIYETVEEKVTNEDPENYLLASSVSSSGNIIKPEKTKLVDNFAVSCIEEDNMPILPELTQRPINVNVGTETVSHSPSIDVEEYFSKTIALYLRQLSPRHKIKAKVEMMQIIEKYIDLEEGKS